jgi:hypothetical protein
LTLVVDDFGIKYTDKNNEEHLKTSLEEIYTMTSTPTTPTILHGAHWNDDIDDNDDADNSANMTEENTTETFDPDLEYFIITILKGK